MFLLSYFYFPNVIYLHILLLACGCVCVRPVRGENRRGECFGLHILCLYPLPRHVFGRDDCSSCTGMPNQPPHPSWCLCWRTPTAHWKLRLEGHFNFSDSAWTVVSVSLLFPPLPSCLSSQVMQSLLCPPSSFADWEGHWLFSCCLFCCILVPCALLLSTGWLYGPIDPLNRPWNSSLHQSALCWPRQHSTYKVDGLQCHTPHYCKWVGSSLTVIPSPYNISLHCLYLYTV